MTITKTSALLAAAALAGIVAITSTANAGGLFGKGGLIRGDVGNFLDKHLEQPVLTPLAQGAAVAGGTAVGAAAGTYVGGPTGGAIGGAVGAEVGNTINNCAAGHCR